MVARTPLVLVNGVPAELPAADTLSNYAEGTFTPALLLGGASTGITYSTQTGRFTKIGRLVTVQVKLVLSSKGVMPGGATLSGLPFTASSVLNHAGILALSAASSLANTAAFANPGTTVCNLLYSNAGTLLLIDASQLTNTSEFYITITYTT